MKIRDWKFSPQYQRAGLVLLPWLIVAVNALVAKYNQILMQAVPDALVGAPPFHFSNHIYQFAPDLFVGFVLMPAVILVLMRWIPSRWMLLVVSVGSVLCQIIMSAEMATYAMANSYATFRTMVLGFMWAVRHPKNQFLTLPLFDKIYVLGWIGLVGLGVVIVYLLPVQRKHWWNRTALVICVVGASASVASAFVPAEEGPLTSIYRDVVTGLVERTDSNLMSKSIPELLETYREDARMEDLSAAPSQFEGKARGYNIVLIVMESISAEVFDPARDSLVDMPNIRRLRQTAFVSREHFTSYPLTNRASFAVFTSLYAETAVGLAVGDRDIKLPSMVRDLDNAGYHTGYYGFVWKDEDERDDSMLDAIGFQKIEDPLKNAPELPSAELMFGGPVMQAAAIDHQALAAMRQDIRKWSSQKQRFAAAFFPEMGHDPWRNVTKHENASVKEMGHALAVYQDTFVGEVIDELQRDGALDHTIIVVTADHGQRVIADDNGEEVLISHGRLDERTMRIPLLIYVPKVLRKTVVLPGPTSHIDVAPTLLSLLGLQHNKELEQGTVMWNPEIARRRLFLPMKVFGASGYYENGKFYSSNQGMVYRTNAFPFSTAALPYNSEEARNARELVARHGDIQNVLLQHLIEGTAAPITKQ
jgi:arylsulfatase A-like enzyme